MPRVIMNRLRKCVVTEEMAWAPVLEYVGPLGAAHYRNSTGLDQSQRIAAALLPNNIRRIRNSRC